MAESGAGNRRCADVATVAGMVIGGWMSGGIFDLTGSYRAAFPAWPGTCSIWRSPSGIEHLTLSIESGQVIARSVVIGERGGCPYGVRYMIVCDAGWVIHTLDLETTAGQTLSLVKDGDGRWTDQSGAHLPDLTAASISISPARRSPIRFQFVDSTWMCTTARSS